jgi:hypothetical protein
LQAQEIDVGRQSRRGTGDAATDHVSSSLLSFDAEELESVSGGFNLMSAWEQHDSPDGSLARSVPATPLVKPTGGLLDSLLDASTPLPSLGLGAASMTPSSHISFAPATTSSAVVSSATQVVAPAYVDAAPSYAQAQMVDPGALSDALAASNVLSSSNGLTTSLASAPASANDYDLAIDEYGQVYV